MSAGLKTYSAYGVTGLNKYEADVARMWDGDVDSTAKLSGLTKSVVERAIRNDLVLQAIRAREQYEDRSHTPVASRKRRQQFWTEIMFDESVSMQQRIKASELLGKSEADFTDKVQGDYNLTLGQMLDGLDEKPARRSVINDDIFN